MSYRPRPPAPPFSQHERTIRPQSSRTTRPRHTTGEDGQGERGSYLAQATDQFFQRPLPQPAPVTSTHTRGSSDTTTIPIQIASLVWGTPPPLHMADDRIINFQPRQQLPVKIVKRSIPRPTSAYSSSGQRNQRMADLQVSRDFQRMSGLTQAFVSARQSVADREEFESLATDRVILASSYETLKESTNYRQEVDQLSLNQAKEEKQQVMEVVKEVTDKLHWNESCRQDLQQQVKIEQSAKEQVASQLTNLTHHHQQLQEESKEQAEVLGSTKDELKHLQFHHTLLAEHIATKDPIIERLEKENLALKLKIGEGVQREQVLREEVKAEKEKKHHLRAEIQAIKSQKEFVTIQCSLLKTQIQTEKDQHSKLVQQYQILKQTDDEVRKNTAQMEMEASILQSQLETTTSQFQKITSRDHDIGKQLSTVITRLEAENATLKKSLADAQDEITRRTSDHKDCDSIHRQQSDKIASLETKVTELQGTIKDNFVAAQKKYQELIKKYAHSEKELQTLKTEMFQLESRFTELQQAKRSLEKRLKEVEEEAEREAQEEVAAYVTQLQKQMMLSRQGIRSSGTITGAAEDEAFISSRSPSRTPTMQSRRSSRANSPGPSPSALSSPLSSPRQTMTMRASFGLAAPSGARSKAHTLGLLLETANATIVQLHKELATQTESMKDMAKKIQVLRCENDAHGTNISKLQETSRELRQQVDEKERQNKGLQLSVAEARTQSEISAKEAQSKLDSVTANFQTTIRLNQELFHKVKTLTEELKRNQTFSQHQQSAHIEKVEKMMEEAKQEAEKERAAKEIALAAAAEAQQQREQLSTEFTSFKTTASQEQSTLQTRVSELEGKIFSTNITLRSTQLHCGGLKLRISQREKQIRDLQAKATSDEQRWLKERETWSEEIHATKEKLIVAVAKLRAHADQMKEVRNEVQTHKNEVVRLQDQLRSAQLQQVERKMAAIANAAAAHVTPTKQDSSTASSSTTTKLQLPSSTVVSYRRHTMMSDAYMKAVAINNNIQKRASTQLAPTIEQPQSQRDSQSNSTEMKPISDMK